MNEISPISVNTRIAYDKGWAAWCAFTPEPYKADADTVAAFLKALAEKHKMGTVQIYKSAVNYMYEQRGLASPTKLPRVRNTMRGLMRLYGRPPKRVRAIRAEEVVRMIEHTPDTLIGYRDAAILAVGFAAALRRSEICAIKIEDLDIRTDQSAMTIIIPRSKTDQGGAGQVVHVPNGQHIRPVHRLLAWCSRAGISDGYVYQTMRRGGRIMGKPLHHSDIPRLVKHYAAKIGIDPKEVAGHSLRAGFITSAAANHARLDKIMAVSRHTNPSTVMKYIRDENAYEDHAGQSFL